MDDDKIVPLLAEYDRSVKEYSEAVTKLRGLAGTCSGEQYVEVMRSVDLARLSCERARLTLDRHMDRFPNATHK